MLGLLKGAAGKIAKSRVGKGFAKAGKKRLDEYKDRIEEIGLDLGINRVGKKKKKKKAYQKPPARQMRA